MSAETTAPPRSGGRSWRRATAAVGLLWVVTATVVVVATGAIAARDPVAVAPAPGFGGWPAPTVDATGLELLRTGLVRHDALWYLAIGADGYPTTAEVPQAAAFLPGYPLLVALVGTLLGGRLVVAALLVSFAATVAAVVGLQRLAVLVVPADADGIRGAVTVVTLVFPTSFFLLAPYAESLLLAASVWALVHAAEGRPWASAGLAAVATVTRPPGVLLAVPLLLGVTAANRPPPRWWRDPVRRRAVTRRHVVPVLGVGVGGVALLAHGTLAWGDPFAVVAAQDGWRTPSSPVTALIDGVRLGLEALGGGATPYHLLDLLVLALGVVGVVVLARRREWPLVTHAAASLLLWSSTTFPDRPLMSTPRFALAVPAVVLGLALLARRDGLGRAVVPTCSVLFAVHLVLYTRWWFVF